MVKLIYFLYYLDSKFHQIIINIDVYIIYSKSLDRYYTGLSNNPIERIRFHNLGKSGSKSSFTKRANDWILVFRKRFDNKTEALKFEKNIKRQKSRTFIEDLINNRD